MHLAILLILSIFAQEHAMAGPSTTYGLQTGAAAPQIATKDIDGKSFDLHAEVKKGPVVLVFYRGGWCPYCNLQLRNLEKGISADLKKLGASMVAISVDTVEEGLKTDSKEKLSAVIISDPEAKILGDYKVKFTVPQELVTKYKNEYKIDIEASSGKKHHIIAVPAVYVVDSKGTITYSYVDENYKVRAPEADIVKAVSDLKAQPSL